MTVELETAEYRIEDAESGLVVVVENGGPTEVRRAQLRALRQAGYRSADGTSDALSTRREPR